MEKNTIAYLNTKIWYRFLKIIYVFIFISASVYALRMVIDEYSPYETLDYNKSLIICNNGDIYTFKKAYGDGSDETLKRLCLTAEETRRRELCRRNPDSGLITPKEFLKFKKCKEISLNYKTKSIYKTIGGWHLVFGYFILAMLIICVALEIIKRVFYYLVFGKFRPKK